MGLIVGPCLQMAQAGEGCSAAVAAFGGASKMAYHERRAMEERTAARDPAQARLHHCCALYLD